MTIFGASGEQKPRGFIADVYAIMEDQLELVSAGEFAIDRKIHAMEFRGHRAFQLAGKCAH